MAMEGDATSWARRHALALVAAAPLGPAILGSVFNIWYNVIHIQPLFVADQEQRFHQAIVVYNLAVYPVGIAVWLSMVLSIGRAYWVLLDGRRPADALLQRSRARTINLPWHFAGVLVAGWFGCIPAFLWALSRSPAPVHADLPMHLSISIAIAALITITHGVLVVELVTHKLLYPVLFQESQPFKTAGALPISLRRRGLLWAISAGACPIASLLLLAMIDARPGAQERWFTLSVGILGIAFGLVSAGLMSRLVIHPVERLRDASAAVASGDLRTRVDLLRADEFGPLIDEFNRMVREMREKQKLRETFGLHVGRRAAEQILARDPGLGGRLLRVTVLFCDIRGFTDRCGRLTPEQTVSLLNRFFTAMVRIVEEEHGGMVNKFLGDGLMALFNGAGDQPHHATAAVAAGRRMLRELKTLNAQTHGEAHLAMGIGIHSGDAVVGTIGSDQRLEYTAIGATVNLASRIESLTKSVGTPLLLTEATRQELAEGISVRELPPQRIRGVAGEVRVYALDESESREAQDSPPQTTELPTTS